jgi:hypothetical protein
MDGKRSEEENSFFNQPSVDKKPLTKDSIMALYAQSTPAVQQPQFPGMSKLPPVTIYFCILINFSISSARIPESAATPICSNDESNESPIRQQSFL